MFGVFKRKRDHKLEYLSMMDKISQEVRYSRVQIAKCQGVSRRNERKYWEDKWEELVTVYEEFEWGLHPQNPERYY